MAVYIYGLTYTDVVAEIPRLESSNVSATTEPVSTTSIAQWLEDGAAKFNGTLSKSGITADATMATEHEDAHASVAAAVKAYAVMQVMAVLGMSGPVYDAAASRFTEIYSEISSRPQQLGAAYSDTLVTVIDQDQKSDEYSFLDNEGSIW